MSESSQGENAKTETKTEVDTEMAMNSDPDRKRKRAQKIAKTPGPKTQYTVKCRLHAKTDAIRLWIEHGVDVATQMAIHVSRFANMYVLYCVEHDRPIPKIDNDFFYRIGMLLRNVNMNPDEQQQSTKGEEEQEQQEEENELQVGAEGAETAERAEGAQGGEGVQDEVDDPHGYQQMSVVFDALYRPLLPVDFRIDRTAADHEFLKRLFFDMETNVRAYLRTQFLIRFRDWCKQIVGEIIPIDTTGRKTPKRTAQLDERYKIVSYLFSNTVVCDSDVTDIETLIAAANADLSAQCSHVWSENVARRLAQRIAEMRLFFTAPEYRPITYGKLRNVDLSPVYLRWLALRMRQIEQWNSNPARKQKKLFSIVPIASLDRKYVAVESSTLRRFIHRNRKNEAAIGSEMYAFLHEMGATTQARTEEVFGQNALYLWKLCFKFESKLGKVRKFDYRLTTDGVGCSLQYIKLGENRKTRAEEREEKRREKQLITLEDDDHVEGRIRVFSEADLVASDILGVDPGRKDLFTTVIEKTRPEENGTFKHSVHQYSSARWNYECGGADAKQKRARWMKQAGDGYEQWLLAMPTCKVSTVAAMQAHVRHLMLGLERHLKENGKHRVRNLRFANYVKNQKALEKMTDEFINAPKHAVGSKKEKTIVAFGDASFKTSGPVQKMKQKLRKDKNVTIVDIDEFNTSKLTTCCAFPQVDYPRGLPERAPKAVERVGPRIPIPNKKRTSKRQRRRARVERIRAQMLGQVEEEGQKEEEEEEETAPVEERRGASYRVTFCTNCSCIWNRDVNAALDILRLFQYAQSHRGARHPLFCRPCRAGTAAAAVGAAAAVHATTVTATNSNAARSSVDATAGNVEEDEEEEEAEEAQSKKRVCRNAPSARVVKAVTALGGVQN